MQECSPIYSAQLDRKTRRSATILSRKRPFSPQQLDVFVITLLSCCLAIWSGTRADDLILLDKQSECCLNVVCSGGLEHSLRQPRAKFKCIQSKDCYVNVTVPTQMWYRKRDIFGSMFLKMISAMDSWKILALHKKWQITSTLQINSIGNLKLTPKM